MVNKMEFKLNNIYNVDSYEAAKNLNRQYLGFEIDSKWAQVAKDRLNNIDATGQISLLTF